MASILIDNGNLTGPALKPGARLRYLQDGTITGSAKFGVRLGSAGSGITIGDPHPWNNLALCSDSEVEYNESEAEIDALYIGVWSSAVQKVVLLGTTTALPIQQCLNWADADMTAPDGALIDFALVTPDGQFTNFPIDPSYTGPGKTGPNGDGRVYPNTTPYRLSGVTSFYQGSTTIRISYSTTEPTTVTAAFEKLGSTNNSLVAGKITFSFDFDAILCTSITYEETDLGTSGDAQWTVTEEYLLLPSPGLDPAVYN